MIDHSGFGRDFSLATMGYDWGTSPTGWVYPKMGQASVGSDILRTVNDIGPVNPSWSFLWDLYWVTDGTAGGIFNWNCDNDHILRTGATVATLQFVYRRTGVGSNTTLVPGAAYVQGQRYVFVITYREGLADGARIYEDGKLKDSDDSVGVLDMTGYTNTLLNNWNTACNINVMASWNRALLPGEVMQASLDPLALVRLRPRTIVRAPAASGTIARQVISAYRRTR